MDNGILVSNLQPGNKSLSKAEPRTEILLSLLHNIMDQYSPWRQYLDQSRLQCLEKYESMSTATSH